MNKWPIVEALRMCGSRVRRTKSLDTPTVREAERGEGAHQEGQP